MGVGGLGDSTSSRALPGAHTWLPSDATRRGLSGGGVCRGGPCAQVGIHLQEALVSGPQLGDGGQGVCWSFGLCLFVLSAQVMRAQRALLEWSPLSTLLLRAASPWHFP